MLFSVLVFAAEGEVSVNWTSLLFGYGPLGIFAVLVGLDKIGNNSERDKLREQNERLMAINQELHSKIESDIVPALTRGVENQQKGSEALAHAIETIKGAQEKMERLFAERAGRGG